MNAQTACTTGSPHEVAGGLQRRPGSTGVSKGLGKFFLTVLEVCIGVISVQPMVVRVEGLGFRIRALCVQALDFRAKGLGIEGSGLRGI